jgi:cobalt/nickel transport system permease protein
VRAKVVAAALCAIAALAALGGPFASDDPDGLQRVARDEGFARAEDDHALEDAPLAGYEVDGVKDERVATGLSGVAGVALVFAAATAVFGVTARAKARRRGVDP